MLAEQTTEPPLDQLLPVAGHAERSRRSTRRGGCTWRSPSTGSSSRSCATPGQATGSRSEAAHAPGSPAPPAKARALVERRDFVVPEDVVSLAGPVLAHRLILAPEARATGVTVEEVVAEALDATPTPV